MDTRSNTILVDICSLTREGYYDENKTVMLSNPKK